MTGWIVAAWILVLNPLALVCWIALGMTLVEELRIRKERRER